MPDKNASPWLLFALGCFCGMFLGGAMVNSMKPAPKPPQVVQVVLGPQQQKPCPEIEAAKSEPIPIPDVPIDHSQDARRLREDIEVLAGARR